MRPIVAALFVLLFAAGSALALRWATDSGVALTTDSLRYLNVAESLLKGDGFVISRAKSDEPLTHFAPLYPLVIAIAAKVSRLAPDDAARWVQIALLPANVLLIALLAFRATRGSVVLTVLAALAAACAAALLRVHQFALSEGLFLCLQGAALVCLLEYFRGQRRWVLLSAGVLASLTLLTRYAGVALVAAGFLAVVWINPAPLRRRLIDGLIFATVSLVLPGAWIVRNMLKAETAVNRGLEFHPLTASHVDSAITTLGNWLAPPASPTSITHLLLGIVATLLIVGLLRHRRDRQDADLPHQTTKTLVLYGITYVLMLVVSISFIDYYTPLDGRILSPLYPVGLVCLAGWIHRLLPQEGVAARRVLASIALLLLAGQLAEGALTYGEISRASAGFSSRKWADSKLLARLKTFPEETPVYSNAPDVITLATGRKAVGLPAQYDAATGVPYSDFNEKMQAFRTRFRGDDNAVLVYFRRVKRPFLPSEGYLRKRVVLRTVYNTAEGAIYKRAALTPIGAAPPAH